MGPMTRRRHDGQGYIPGKKRSVQDPDPSRVYFDFFKLPPEILHRILIRVGSNDTVDLTSLVATCSQFHHHIYEDPERVTIWRGIHRHLFDDPRQSILHLASNMGEPLEVDWQKEVMDRRTLEEDFGHCSELFDDYSSAPATYFPRIERCSETINSLLDAVPSSNSHKKSKNLKYLEILMNEIPFSSIHTVICDHWEQAKRGKDLSEDRIDISDQRDVHYLSEDIQAGKLHNKMNLSFQGPQPEPLTLSRLERVAKNLGRLYTLQSWYYECRQFQETELEWEDQVDDAEHEYHFGLGIYRSFVYSIDNFSKLNDFGPFHVDGTVDWHAVSCIHSVMDANMIWASGRHGAYEKRVLRPGTKNAWKKADPPARMGATHARGQSLNGLSKEEIKDWAGIMVRGEPGVWRGTFAFMDHIDWLKVNNDREMTREERQAYMVGYTECIGEYLKQEFTLEIDEAVKALPNIVSTLPRSDLLPPIQFCGESSMVLGHDEKRSVRGEVVLTPDHQVRWTWVVRYDGEDQWRLSAVQIGGRNSPRGVVGIWSSAKPHDPHSPCGPFAYFPTGTAEDDKALLTRKKRPNGVMPLRENGAQAIGTLDEELEESEFSSGDDDLVDWDDGDEVFGDEDQEEPEDEDEYDEDGNQDQEGIDGEDDEEMSSLTDSDQ